MTTELKVADKGAGIVADDGEVSLGFALNFISGRGLLSAKEKKLGHVELRTFELEIPNIAFPFDVTGGADRFKTRRCVLRHLVFSLDAEGLTGVLAKAPLADHGFVELKAALREGFIEFAGRFRVGEAQADFTFRAAPVLRSRDELGLTFYDARVYGFLPVPSSLLPVYLFRALKLDFIEGERAGLWTFKPAEQFVRNVMPQSGWKIPDTRHAQLVAAEVARGRLTVAAGPEGELSQKQLLEREPPTAAVLASEGVTAFAEAEKALGKGAIALAYEKFREALDDERGGRWARERLLQIGAADPELALETRQLAEEVLAQDPKDVQALTALAAIALRERSWGEAANRYGALAEIAQDRKDRLDVVAAELAAAAAAAPVDPAGALAAYERAAARARDSVVAHRALFDLRFAMGDWDGVARAGDRLVRLVTDPLEQAAVHRQLGQVHRVHLRDLKQARVHFERALKLTPDDPTALEGLAETYAARGEPARAASYLARLAEQAEESGDKDRIVALNLRLGEIWERWLSDREAAATRYYRVLDVQPNNRTARLRLAELAEAKGDLARARGLYEDVLAAEDTSADPAAIPDLVAAYTRLARVTMSSAGASQEAIACLERATELDPTNRLAREELGKLLRARGEWGRLIHLLEEAARVSQSPEEARRARLDAARLEILERKNQRAAEKHLEQILDARPDDADALDLILPILEARKDETQLAKRLYAAADTTLEPERKGALLFRLAQAQSDQSAASQNLLAALDAHPYLGKAAELLVTHYQKKGSAEQRVLAYLRLAIAAPTREARAHALEQRAIVLLRELGRTKDAEQALREATELDPARVTAWVQLAKLREDAGQLELSAAALERALLATPPDHSDRAMLFLRLAELAEKTKESDKQAKYLRLALASGAGDETVRGQLVEVLGRLGQQAEVAELLETWSLSTTGESRDKLRLEAAALREALGETATAIELYRTVVADKRGPARRAAQALERLGHAANDPVAVAQAVAAQLEVAPTADHQQLLVRLLGAQIEAGDTLGAEATCLRLLELNQHDTLAHLHLAEHYETTGALGDALEHWVSLLIDAPKDDDDRPTRRARFEHAGALALEVGAAEHARLRKAFDKEFPEAPPSALERPLGDRFLEQQDFEGLLKLRRYQLETLPNDRRGGAWRKDVAEILHLRKGQSAEAIPYYQDVIAQRPDDMTSRNALIDIFDKLGRNNELATLLFAMSQLTAAPDEATAYGLRSVRVFADKLSDHESAEQVMRILVARDDVDPDDTTLLAELRRFRMLDELSQLLERSIEAEADPDDGRFHELVDLLSSVDPARAAAWCERMIEAFPMSDVPRRSLVDLRVDRAETGDPADALRDWADARDGKAKARVLAELAARYQAGGNNGLAMKVLAEAAEADPTAEPVLQQLVDRATALGDFAQVVQWLERLALATDPGPAQDERWRRLVEVASDYADDPHAVMRALESITYRKEDETRLLAQLYIEQGEPERIADLANAADILGAKLLLDAGRALCGASRLAEARKMLERAMELGSTREAWAVADVGFAKAGKLEELGRWRLEAARHVKGKEATVLKLAGYADLAEGGRSPEELLAPSGFEALAREIDLRDADAAWSLFRAARALGFADWRNNASAALLGELTEADSRLPVVLKARIEEELAAGRADDAVGYAERLAAVGDPEADRWLDQALLRAGRRDELLALLTKKAEAAGDEAGPLWSRIAALEVEDGHYVVAAAALDKVAPEQRSLRWGELAWITGQELDDTTRQVEAAALCAKLSADDHEACASWLRRCAGVVWWSLGDEARAKTFLQQAYDIAPDSPADIRAHAETALKDRDRDSAKRMLAEATAVDRGEDGASLWILRGRVAADDGDLDQALKALDAAESAMPADGALYAELGAVAERSGEIDRAVRALLKATKLDVAHEAEYLAVLERHARWDVLVQALEARIPDDPLGANERLIRAAEITQQQLGDKPRALGFYERAVKAAPSLTSLEPAFHLAAELGKTSVVAALGGGLLKRLGPDVESRGIVLRAFVDALDHLGLAGEAHAAREELMSRREANAKDRLALGRVYAEEGDARAAEHLEAAALDAVPPEPAETLLLEAAQAWAGKDDARARSLLREALARGNDDVAAHKLGTTLFDGAERLLALESLVTKDGDQSEAAPARAASRLEVAEAMLERGDAAPALELLEAAGNLAPLPRWPTLTEQALKALEKHEQLATHYLTVIERGGSGWKPEEELARLQTARTTFEMMAQVAEEQRVLELIAARDPEAAGVGERLAALAAELGDQDRYLDVARAQIAQATGSKAAVAARFAEGLMMRFEDADAAVALAAPVFADEPTPALGATLAKSLDALGRGNEVIDLFMAGAEKSKDAVILLEQAAERARDDSARAFDIYGRILQREPRHEAALDFSLEFAAGQGKHAEAVGLLVNAAAAASGAQAHDDFLRASVMARDELKDPKRELELLKRALEAERRPTTLAELIDRQLDRGDVIAANTELLRGELDESSEIQLAQRLVQSFEDAEQEGESERVMTWFEGRHPEHPAAARYKLTRARRHGDFQSVLDAVNERLATPQGMEPDEIAALHGEAGHAAQSLGDVAMALAHYRLAVRAEKPVLEHMLAGWTLASQLGAHDVAGEVIERATGIRDAIFTHAAAQKGKAQVRWLELLGQAHEAANDEGSAIGAYSQAVLNRDEEVGGVALSGLERIYTRRGDWQRLIELYDDAGVTAKTPSERAEAYTRAGLVWRDRLVDEGQAEDYLKRALSHDPQHAAAQLQYGLLLFGRQKFPQALPYLQAQVKPQQEGTPVDHVVALAECLRLTGDNGRALALTERVIEIEPTRPEPYAHRAELFEATGKVAEAEASWLQYLDVLGAGADADVSAPVYTRLGRAAQARGDVAKALAYLEQAHRQKPDLTDVMTELRVLYEKTEAWTEAADLRLREVALAADTEAQLQHYRALAVIFRDKLNDPRRSAAMLEKAAEARPDDVSLLSELLRMHEAAQSWPKFLVVGERLLTVKKEAELDTAFLAQMARAYQEGAGDLVRAKEFYGKALEREPTNAQLRDKHKTLAEATGDYPTFAKAEEDLLATYPPSDEKAQRLVALADVYVKHLGQLDKAQAALLRAKEIKKDDKELARKLADTYALDAKTYTKAADLYRATLNDNPLDAELLRILARLSGQLGDTDRAYGYYAALLTLLPSDSEARRFVTACRAARPPGPQRPLTDADRAQGLIHPGQANPVEEVFTPLARFAELTLPGDLNRRGVAERDQLAPTDPRKQYLRHVLEPLGLPQAALYVWRGGGFACEVELTNPPTILLGSVLADDAPERQRAFLVSRSAELYRSGHLLCEKLNPGELGALVAAICQAVSPTVRAPGHNMESERWAPIIAAPMTAQIKGVMTPKVQAYAQKPEAVDLADWRRAALSTAARTALLVACDVEEAVSAMIRIRGFDDVSDEQRVEILREAPEELDLLRFATSEQYYKLRQALGLALRRSK